MIDPDSVDRYYDAAGNLTAQVYVTYASDGSATEKAFYSTEVRENSGGYVKLESATYDKSGNVTGWTRYNENGSPRYSKSTTSWVDESANTIGGKKTYTEYTIVTETEYDEYGNVVSENQQEFIAVRDRSDYNERKNALQKYLEEKTGVTRGSDWP